MISQLKESVREQLLLFPDAAEEIPNREIGGYYTPQYIAGFFARFLASEFTPPRFRDIKVADPACGSGIFLRTLLEWQCDPLQRIDVALTAERAFANVLGMDVEPNASKAARLSLSLLYLVLTGGFPKSLKIVSDEAIDFIIQHPEIVGTFDAVIANPPFVKWENIPQEWQARVAATLSGYNAPKADLYLAFIKIGLQLIKPGGFLLYVLPHTFLLAQNSQTLRKDLSNSCWIRFLVDLSEIDVFDEVNAYPVLLILQKKGNHSLSEPPAVIVRCSSYPGHALEEALEGRSAKNGHYSITTVDQAVFQADAWHSLNVADRRLQEKIQRFPKLETFALLKQGFITGYDRVFIRKQTDVPSGESAAYISYLSDREMRRFQVPNETSGVVFYPFDGERMLTEAEVRERFPETWKYLEANESPLKARKSIDRVKKELWWRPVRPRPPKHLLRPKIVSPHLMLFPRFSLDAEGKYGVSHSAMLFSKGVADDLRLLKYFLGVLNSSVGHWQIVRQSHKYRRGYAMLEVNTLRNFFVPSPATVNPRAMNSVISSVNKLISDPSDEKTEQRLNATVMEIYGVSMEEFQEIVLPPIPHGVDDE